MIKFTFHNDAETTVDLSVSKLTQEQTYFHIFNLRDFGIKMIYADGAEHELIKKAFLNVPISSQNVTIWEGEMAKFIATNIIGYLTDSKI